MVPTTTTHAVAFWLLGLVNNIPYVIMIAGAKEINSGGVAIVYVSEVLPSLLVQFSGPYWFQYVSYKWRIYLSGVLMALSFVTVVFGMGSSLALQLVGVAFNGMQQAIGESSLLAYASRFDNSRLCLTTWSSGTGVAGIAGFAWVTLFTSVADLQTTLLLALIFPAIYVIVFALLLAPEIHRPVDDIELKKPESLLESPVVDASTLLPSPELQPLGFKDGVRLTLSLWPYMVPLFIVYAAEYSSMAGTWAAIGFPLDDAEARTHFYRNAGFAYQGGVFLARSSGTWIRLQRWSIMALSLLQVALFGFFFAVATYTPHAIYNYGLIVPCIITGIIGGLVYVNSFTLLADEVPHYKEFALAASSVAMNVGVLVADVAGLYIQGCLYAMHRIAGATVEVACKPIN
ncbi:Aste57867_10702 [Aphanomyces stellatus]|uniref:Aste57867_10702 protein n=1 Tax=Aphanomyces stellatus TaxID=120398 RepID=A0A485KRN1_9STRA|nr:hypothetical protein As57867_010662 [Aphanomyces stellatus]VFT87572.1 Aste57867_10702 [Aphanomyces stellatus]